jgi:Flp pilus assembly protein protease CpaA
MLDSLFANKIALLAPLTAAVTWHDVRSRTIPNSLVLAAMLGGIAIHIAFGHWEGLRASAEGCVLAFSIAFVLYLKNWMSAGDVKLFAAAGAIVNSGHVLGALKVVTAVGALLGVWSLLRARSEGKRPETVPYGVAITSGSLLSIVVFQG